MLDLRIVNGTIVDGTGTPGRPESVAIRDGRFVEDDPDESAARTINADGQIVAPGFVDIHTHYDGQVFWDPWLTPSCLHGVTTAIAGNCGYTLAPVAEDSRDYMTRLFARVEGVPLATLEAAVPFDWSSPAELYDRVEGTTALNYGLNVGHSAIRVAVMGERAVGESATAQEIDAMARILDGALRAGALGFSTSSSGGHLDAAGNPVPSRWATREELLSLAEVVGRHPGTLLQTNPGGIDKVLSEDYMDLIAEMSRIADRPLNWNLFVVRPADPNLYLNRLEASDRAEAKGACVKGLLYPDALRLLVTLSTGFMIDLIPEWGDTMHLPLDEKIRALRDASVRERLRRGATSVAPTAEQRTFVQWDRYVFAIANDPQIRGYIGRTVGDVARERDEDPFDTFINTSLVDELGTYFEAPVEDDSRCWEMRAQLANDKRMVLGGSDAGGHLDVQCGANLPTVVLSQFRDRGLMSLEESVRQLTDRPARFYGLRDRGRIAPGYYADLVVFDPETVGARMLETRFDLPGGAMRVHSEANGIERVLVNGTEIVVSGETTEALPGSFLRSGRDTTTQTNAIALAADTRDRPGS